MKRSNQEHEFSSEPYEAGSITFTSKLEALLPSLEFKESAAMLEARTAVLEALARTDQNANSLHSVWVEYADICEQTIDARSEIDPRDRAKLQIAILVHKALIFREAGDTQRYSESLGDAKEYAYNMYFDEIVEAIQTELDSITD